MKTAAVSIALEADAACEDCYFRREFLCALADGPCPTFRSVSPSARSAEPTLVTLATKRADVTTELPLRL